MLQPPRDAGEYYPPASLRLDETGRVVLRFTVDADGKAIEPFGVDEEQSVSPSERLIAAARSYLKDSKFASRSPYTKSLTASFVFELAPCGTLRHSSRYDYAVEVCRDRPPPPDVINPGVGLTHE
jgi:outer membrane biosynthesis protein TonB